MNHAIAIISDPLHHALLNDAQIVHQIRFSVNNKAMFLSINRFYSVSIIYSLLPDHCKTKE